MSKENLMFAVIGLMIGAIIGFMFANSVNKGTIAPAPVATTANTAGPLSGNPALPADHPPLGTSSGDTTGGGGAIPQVTEAIQRAKDEPQNFEAQMTAADLYYQIQRYDDAARFYEAALKLKSNDIEPLIKAGNSYFDAERYDEAEKRYALALEREPKNINVRNDYGLTFFLREPRDIDRAITEFDRALAVDPNHEITLQNLAIAYKEKGDAAKLGPAIERLKKVNPQNPALKELEGTGGTS
ncbi:MAG: tetratricopeptide repeat protein [Pyrinomonadaceae bacterium]